MGLLNDTYIYQLVEDTWNLCKDNVDPIEQSRYMMSDKLEKEFAKILGDDYLEDGSGICSDLAYEIVKQYSDFEERYERDKEESPWQEAQRDVVRETMRNL